MRNLRAQSFGGDVIAENDPDEQQKRLRYNDMVASSVILQNTGFGEQWNQKPT